MFKFVFKIVRRHRIIRPRKNRRDYLKNKHLARELVLKKIQEFLAQGFVFNRVAIKNHTSRWGSCSKKGNLNFNYKIMYLPEQLAEYIVVHELCHLKVLNHSREFWDLLKTVLPDCHLRRQELRKIRMP